MANTNQCVCGAPCSDDDRYMDDLANVFCSDVCLEKYGQFCEDWRGVPDKAPVCTGCPHGSSPDECTRYWCTFYV